MNAGICGKCGSSYVGVHICGDDGSAERRRYALLNAATACYSTCVAGTYERLHRNGNFRQLSDDEKNFIRAASIDAATWMLAEIERRETAKRTK